MRNWSGCSTCVCNWGGGNTSAKSDEIDFRGRHARVVWVKGSGSDLATVTEASFTGLYLDDVQPLLERERMSDTEMVDYLAHCFYEPGRPRPSIETLLHGFLPFTHIDHTHADATNYFACARDGEQLARDCFGDDLIWIPYRRPGFGLAREVALAVRAKPHAKLVILAKHGLITWGETDESCYASTLSTIAQARDFVEARVTRADRTLFGGFRCEPMTSEERHSIAAQVAPVLRGLVSAEKRQIVRFEESEDVLTFASSQDASRLTQIGAACPDHLVHTKPWPLLVDWTPDQAVSSLGRGSAYGRLCICREVSSLSARQCGARSRSRCRHAGLPRIRRRIRSASTGDPDPWRRYVHHRQRCANGRCLRATLPPSNCRDAWGRGVWRFHLAEFDAESYAVEYWPLEQYKLKLAPPEREFSRQVVLVTGAAGGIGSAICRRVAQDGAHIVATDIDLAECRGTGNVPQSRSSVLDVRSP